MVAFLSSLMYHSGHPAARNETVGVPEAYKSTSQAADMHACTDTRLRVLQLPAATRFAQFPVLVLLWGSPQILRHQPAINVPQNIL